jgi:hypothetical protein
LVIMKNPHRKAPGAKWPTHHTIGVGQGCPGLGSSTGMSSLQRLQFEHLDDTAPELDQ